MKVAIKTPAQLSVMRSGGEKLVEILKILKSEIKPGITLKALDKLAKEASQKLGAVPAFLGYEGYPASTCLSVNSGIVHCIPTDDKLQEGDLISIDFGLLFEGMYTDSAVTLIVGRDLHGYGKLLRSTYEALLAGTVVAKAGITIGEISTAIEKSLKGSQLTIMRQFVGHGIGKKLHEPPIVPNFVGHDRDVVLPAGATIAIEPIAGLGGEDYETGSDRWSTHTLDNSAVAHYEHTIAITEEGYEILTPLDGIIGVRA
jgi:methionyl aminopeptidase